MKLTVYVEIGKIDVKVKYRKVIIKMDTQMAISTAQIIDLMESGLNMIFSDEQKKILANSFQHPLLVNACAGSGKTTIFILMALVAISKGIVEPNEILGITFSHKSKEDMADRYRKYLWGLADVGLRYPSVQPKFTTFHSLFFHLLTDNEAYQDVKVLSSYKGFRLQLKPLITHPDVVMTKNQMLKQMFRLNNYLINQDLTTDGIHPIGYDEMTDAEIVDKLNQSSKHKQEHDLGFFQDYFAVMTKYQELKKQANSIDFNDMKLLLLQSMNNKVYLKQYQEIMSQYKLAIIDEFQDIDALQWKIISKLLSPETMSHLIVIGDDDQSIYAFRGSDPKYIMNYQKLMPQALTLNLSTNYRTGGQILNCAVPMIQENSIRLDKSLQAFDLNRGKVTVYKSDSKHQNLLLKRLVEQIKDSDINNNDIAVLVRYNSSRTLAADWLANEKIYIDLNNSNLVLQKNSSYQAIVGIMEAFWNDKFKPFHTEAKHIGFSKYLEHVNELTSLSKEKYVTKLSKYLDLAKDNLTSLIKPDSDDVAEEIDSEVLRFWNKVQLLKLEKEPQTTEKLFKIAKELTSNYFSFMIDRNYLSANDLGKLFLHLRNEVKAYSDPAEFFQHERQKESILTSQKKLYNQKLRVRFLSLHQSKGLEFKYVYLYELIDKEVKQGSLLINKYFQPELSFKKFTEIFLKYLAKEPDEITDAYKCAMIGEITDLLDDKNFDVNNISQSLFNENIMQKFNALYRATKKYSGFIEEERRLLYVGVTRAKEELNIEITGDSSPLLNELVLPSLPNNQQVK